MPPWSVASATQPSGDAGKGIFVKVRDDQTGVVKLVLENVSVSGFAYHGVHISYCNLADECGAGSSGKGEGSPASIDVRLSNVKISEVGTGKFDADGIRVDERSAGDIRFYSQGSTFTKVGGDGVELDEGQDGSVIATVIDNTFSDNGAYCNVEVLKPFLPEAAEGDFDDGKVAPSDIPGEVKGSPDDDCFEREVKMYDSGFVKEYEIEIDLDDGFDIDEAGNGDMRALMIRSNVRRNVDEGIDFGERDAGDFSLAVWGSVVQDNTDDGFRTSEQGPGSAHIILHGVESKDNGRKGASFTQADQGDINVLVERTKTGNNGDGDKTGLLSFKRERAPDRSRFVTPTSPMASTQKA
jgi:hypothetical protein